MVARSEEVGIVSEFVVIGCADDGYDVEPDIWEEMACGAGKGEGGADDVLFFIKVVSINSHREYNLGFDVLLSLYLF